MPYPREFHATVRSFRLALFRYFLSDTFSRYEPNHTRQHIQCNAASGIGASGIGAGGIGAGGIGARGIDACVIAVNAIAAPVLIMAPPTG